MKILVPSSGSVPDQKTADYIVNIAKKLNAKLVLLRVFTENKTEATAEKKKDHFLLR